MSLGLTLRLVLMWDIQLFKLNFDEQEALAVSRVVEGGWLTMGDETRRFENAFTSFLGGDVSCQTVSNGTAALHLALLALNIAEGDEVIIPALTFVADANVVKLVGATPRLADVASLQDWNMSVDSLRKQITEKTKAVILFITQDFCKDTLAIKQLVRRKT